MVVKHSIQKDVEMILRNLKGISFEDRTVVVTGGAGFLGSWICDVLVKQGARVVCIDNLSSGLESNIFHLLNEENFKFIRHDISEPINLDEKKIDLIMHLASRASPLEFDKYPIEIIRANTLGTMNMLELARKYNARLLFTSTSEVYGDAKVIPTPETYNGNVNPVGVRGCYDESKRCGEALCMAYLRQYSLDVRIARIFNTYGPRMRADGVYGRVVPRFITQALNNEPITIFGDGKQTRSFCYVTDQIEGLLRLAWFDECKGEVVNIGNPNEITILKLAEIVKKITNSNSEIRLYPPMPDDPRRRCPDISKAKRLLNWTPKVELEEGLRRTVEWFREVV
jgi:UDP-glucuronate decarboxylase